LLSLANFDKTVRQTHIEPGFDGQQTLAQPIEPGVAKPAPPTLFNRIEERRPDRSCLGAFPGEPDHPAGANAPSAAPPVVFASRARLTPARRLLGCRLGPQRDIAPPFKAAEHELDLFLLDESLGRKFANRQPIAGDESHENGPRQHRQVRSVVARLVHEQLEFIIEFDGEGNQSLR